MNISALERSEQTNEYVKSILGHSHAEDYQIERREWDQITYDKRREEADDRDRDLSEQWAN